MAGQLTILFPYLRVCADGAAGYEDGYGGTTKMSFGMDVEMTEEKLDRPDTEYAHVRNGIVDLLQAARAASARSINAVMTATYWEIWRRVVESEMRGENRADYGEKLVEQLARDLTRRLGRGFGRANLWQMRGFYRTWPERNILQTLSGAGGSRMLRDRGSAFWLVGSPARPPD